MWCTNKFAVPNEISNKATLPPTDTKSAPPSQIGASCCIGCSKISVLYPLSKDWL